MTIKEQAAYLKGMMEGLNLDETKGETKLLKSIVDLVHNMSISFEDLEEDMDSVLEQLDVMDEDLAEVEDKVGVKNCGCGCDDEDCYEVVCPNCNKHICLCEESLMDKEMNCPNCGELLEFDLYDIHDGCCSCCDCGPECDCGDDCECECDCDDDCGCGCDK